tara:strand:- start:13 stop:534 length:522 start_codon:yes stop_codon:yes gene_type:complete
MSFIEDLHNAILLEITSNIASIATSGSYPKLQTAIAVPAVFVDLASLDFGDDPATEQLALTGRFEARVIVNAADNGQIRVRELAIEVARVVHNKNFGMKTRLSRVVSIGPDQFSPELDAYDVWLVEWEQQFDIGDSVWDGEGVRPETIFIGYVPRVGEEFEQDYTILDGELPA